MEKGNWCDKYAAQRCPDEGFDLARAPASDMVILPDFSRSDDTSDPEYGHMNDKKALTSARSGPDFQVDP